MIFQGVLLSFPEAGSVFRQSGAPTDKHNENLSWLLAPDVKLLWHLSPQTEQWSLVIVYYTVELEKDTCILVRLDIVSVLMHVVSAGNSPVTHGTSEHLYNSDLAIFRQGPVLCKQASHLLSAEGRAFSLHSCPCPSTENADSSFEKKGNEGPHTVKQKWIWRIYRLPECFGAWRALL